MAATAHMARGSALERSWWLRAPAVLVAPRAVFASLRDDSDEAMEARQEPLNAIIGLAGIAARARDARRTPPPEPIGNHPDRGRGLGLHRGLLYATAVYWLGGGLLYGAARRFGGLGSYRRARSLVALSAAPVALALLTVWPIRIAIYGQNLFRTGGDDWGPGDKTFGGLIYFAFAWTAVLFVIGVRSVHGWSWGRSAATVALAAALPTLFVLATVLSR